MNTLTQSSWYASTDQPSPLGVALSHSRRWIRQRTPIRQGWWAAALPAGALALLIGWALAWFARHDVEATVRQEIRGQLDHAGLAWVTLAVSGQEVVLAGTPPQAADGDRALELARAAQCPSGFGLQTCAVQVVAAFAAPVAASVSASSTQPAAGPAPSACDAALARVLSRSQIAFATNSAHITPVATAALDDLATAAGQCPGMLRIEGHTDAQGPAEANQALSQERAEAVRAALVMRGVPAERLIARGHGAQQPIADNGTEAGRARNRRIEVHAVSERS